MRKYRMKNNSRRFVQTHNFGSSESDLKNAYDNAKQNNPFFFGSVVKGRDGIRLFRRVMDWFYRVCLWNNKLGGTVPSEHLIGKSPEYIEVDTGTYKRKIGIQRAKTAAVGSALLQGLFLVWVGNQRDLE